MLQRRMVQMANERSERWGWFWLRFVIALCALAPTVLHYGWHEPALPVWLLRACEAAALALYLALGVWGLARVEGSAARRDVAATWGEAELVACVLGLAAAWWADAALAWAAGALLAFRSLRLYLRITQLAVPPGMVFVGSFIVLIAVGTAILKLPAATPVGQPISVLDAAFTITSAISQTGLVVRPTGEGFTRFGQIVILIWIQVGALGVLVFGAMIAVVIGSGFGLKATRTLAEDTEQGWVGQLSLRRLVGFIIIFTHGAEIVGAALFYFGWPETWDGAPVFADSGDRLYHAVFFSVSSFCNAGFVTTANSMQGLRTHWTSHGVLAGLIVLGSIGFPVLDNLRRVAWARLRGIRTERGLLIRLTLNTKIVLVATLAVYAGGWLIVFIGEIAQAGVPVHLAALDAHFMTINRTSGFDTIAPRDMGLLSQLTLILLMFIGGSPASVAGGIKMMVFAVLLITVWSTLTGKREVQAFGRTIPDELVRKCTTLIVLSLIMTMGTAGVLAATESSRHPLDALLFESVSAFGTTGLSMGITEDLGAPARCALIAAMFVGRVGSLAVLGALLGGSASRRPRVEYPTESVVVY